MRKATLLMLTIPALLIAGESAEAQFHIRKPQLGVYGGFTKPGGEFKDETGNSWNAGALFKLRLTRTFDIRLDAMYSKLGSRDISVTTGGTAEVRSRSNVVLGSVLAELNLGPDSAQYPGDNSVSPYINAGPAMYRYTFDVACTGECGVFIDENEETKLGLNIGAGANIPFNGIPLFVDLRYHRFKTVFPLSQVENTGKMITVSAGFKIR